MTKRELRIAFVFLFIGFLLGQICVSAKEPVEIVHFVTADEVKKG
jgi:hypothetical protein